MLYIITLWFGDDAHRRFDIWEADRALDILSSFINRDIPLGEKKVFFNARCDQEGLGVSPCNVDVPMLRTHGAHYRTTKNCFAIDRWTKEGVEAAREWVARQKKKRHNVSLHTKAAIPVDKYRFCKKLIKKMKVPEDLLGVSPLKGSSREVATRKAAEKHLRAATMKVTEEQLGVMRGAIQSIVTKIGAENQDE